MKRANFLGAPHFYNLNLCCRPINEAFPGQVYLVGSCLEKRDFRDVDVRVIIDDEEYDKLFSGRDAYDALWALTVSAISEWLASRTGLPIDFQIQKRSKANEEFKGPRHALGIFVAQEGKR